MALNVKLKFLKSTAYAFLVLSMFSGANAVSASDLKQRIKVSAPVVRLSDLFTDIAYDSDKLLFEAPLPGQSQQISTSQLWQIAQTSSLPFYSQLYH